MRHKWTVFIAVCVVIALGVLPASRALAIDPLSLLLSAPWYGSYVCNQGLTRMQLTLRPQSGDDGSRVEAAFVFSADPENPTVPTGSFRLLGSLNRKDHTLVLKQDRWLEQPVDPSYRMVDMEGRIIIGEAQAMIRGRITTYGCQDFMLWQFFAAPAAGR
jgi:hypothetical protein